MANILYVHWNETEALSRAESFVNAGHKVQCHHSTTERLKLNEALPDAVVISLDRLPSHGRAIAEWFVEAKKRRHIPLIFAGGGSEKVASTKAKFPDARYGATEQALALVTEALTQMATAPVTAGRTKRSPPSAGAKSRRRGEKRA